MLKKLLASFVLAAFLLTSLSVPYAQAQNTWYFQNYTDWHTRVYDDTNPDEIFGERYTAAQVEWVIYGLVAFITNHLVGDATLIGCIMRNATNTPQLIIDCVPLLVSFVQALIDGGLIGLDTSQNSALANYTNPIQHILSGDRSPSGIGYIRGLGSKLKLVEEVKAQGFGFQAATAIQTLWVAVRNVTYFLLIIALIAMAFMIMFRVKISPQTVITVQSSIPKVIITLLLITFSYAIAGFMIDLMYVVLGLIAAVLSESGLYVLSPFAGGGNVSWIDMYSNLTGANLGQGLFGVMFFYFMTFLVVGWYAFISNFLGFVGALVGLSEIIWMIIIVIIAIALIIMLVRLCWMLLKTYVALLLLIAVGPILILFGLFGGKGFTGLLRDLASHLAVFAAVGPMLAIAFLFLANALPDFWLMDQLLASAIPFNPNPAALGNSTWLPPFLPFGQDLDLVWLFCSFVVITLIPNVSNIIKSAVSGRPFAYGAAIGAAIGAGAGVAAYPFSAAWGATGDARRDAFTKMIQTRSVEPLLSLFRRRAP